MFNRDLNRFELEFQDNELGLSPRSLIGNNNVHVFTCVSTNSACRFRNIAVWVLTGGRLYGAS